MSKGKTKIKIGQIFVLFICFLYKIKIGPANVACKEGLDWGEGGGGVQMSVVKYIFSYLSVVLLVVG